MIKCPECQKDVSPSATTCPTCGFPIAKMMAEKEKLEKKKGCGGCLLILGVIIFALGTMTFIAAKKSANDLIQTNYETRGNDAVSSDETLSQISGHGSYSNYLTEQNRTSGMFFASLGIAMGIVGLRIYNSKK